MPGDRDAREDQAKTPKSPGGNRKPLAIPSSFQSAGGYGSIVDVGDVETLIEATGLKPSSSSGMELVASRLDRVLTDFVLACDLTDASSATKSVNWIRKTRNIAESFLDCFASTEDGSDPVQAAGALLRGPSGYLEVTGTSLNPRDDVASALKSMSVFHRRMAAAETAYKSSKTGKRPVATLELGLFQQLGLIFVEVFGAEWTFSSDKEGRHTGPALRFCQAVGNLLDVKKPPALRGAEQLMGAIARLRNSDGAAGRMREANGGAIRRR